MKNTSIKKALIYVSLVLSLVLLGSAKPALADTPVYATCTATPYNANVGDSVNWQVQNITGGNGTYTYSWSGTDSLYGVGQNVYKSYSYPGIKSAYVTITSGGQVFNASCSTNIGSSNGYYNSGNLAVSCYATPTNTSVNSSVTWYANATGGNGGYIYSWNGTDGLYGNGTSVYKTYTNPGTKIATVNVYSNGQTITQTCSVNVTDYNNNYYNGYSSYGGPGAVCSDGTLGTWNGSAYHCNNTGYYNGYIPSQTYVAPTTYTNSYVGTPVAGVFLNQVPSTGISAQNIKMILFVLGLFMWSLFASYMIQKKTLSLETFGPIEDQKSKIEAFKKRNLLRKK